MTDPVRSVEIGQMRLYDSVRPALPDDTYQLTVVTTDDRPGLSLNSVDGHFAISGPRFTLSGDDVISVHPPRNAQGSFDEVLPQIVLGRRTLPWERELDPDHIIGDPMPALPDDDGPVRLKDPRAPWLALLLFIDDPQYSEVDVLPQPAPVSSVITDAAVLARMHLGGANPAVNAIEVDSALLRQIAPTKDEVQLLTHARQVNVDDRELAAGDSDGWFAVVMSNRLPTPGFRHRACLVSVEQRSDVVFPSPPDPAGAIGISGKTRLILLYSWTFTAAPARKGGGSFKELSQNLNAGLIAAATTITGHTTLQLQDRAGGTQSVQYRGPLSPQPVARDDLGPYHSADQALRIAADSGTEDVSYSASFEVGRLLGAADARLAQELMRWRREAYLRAARSDVATSVWKDVPAIATPQQDAIDSGLVAPVSLTVFERAGSGAGAPADITGAQVASFAPGLDPQRLAAAWNLSPEQTQKLLASAPPPPSASGSPSGPSGMPSGTDRPPDIIAAESGHGLANVASVAQLQAARRRMVDTAVHVAAAAAGAHEPSPEGGPPR
jgi:hypothetical protein